MAAMNENDMSTTISTPQGRIRGYARQCFCKNHEFIAFKGIPYALPPTGKLRFMLPITYEQWTEDVWDAANYGSPCYQLDLITMKVCGSEDCLYLNVYTPSPSEQLRPVMVWIHGGAFSYGNGNDELYGPDFLLCKDVVFVTINYRLGVLGFLKIDGSKTVTGNQGMKDQVEALKWVQRNIRAYGGDPNNVTIFGQSAGAVSVNLLLLSPLSKNLFHKAILHSGSALNPWGVFHGTMSTTLAATLGCNSNAPDEILEFLQAQTLPVLERGQAQSRKKYDRTNGELSCWSPCVEIDSAHAFLTKPPRELIRSGQFHRVPIIWGYVEDEAFLLWSFLMIEPTFDARDYPQMVPRWIRKHVKDDASLAEIGARIKEFYYGDTRPNDNNKSTFIKLASDIQFNYGIYDAIRMMARHTQIFAYKFNVYSPLNFMSAILSDDGTMTDICTHCDDLGYIFSTNFIRFTPENVFERKLIAMMTAWWTNFAAHNDPNGLDASDENTRWLAVQNADVNYLLIADDEVAMKPALDRWRMKFWRELTEKAEELSTSGGWWSMFFGKTSKL